MLQAYPIILEPNAMGGYSVSVPDLDIDTQGDDLPNAIAMARDAICMWACYEQDVGRSVPAPSSGLPCVDTDGACAVFVDVDFDAYRRQHESRMIRKNVTIPGWLNELAEQANVNFSQCLTQALKEDLGVTNR